MARKSDAAIRGILSVKRNNIAATAAAADRKEEESSEDEDDLNKNVVHYKKIWTEMQTESKPEHCCGNDCMMTKNGHKPGDMHYCVGCGRNICGECKMGRADGEKDPEIIGKWYYCWRYKSGKHARTASFALRTAMMRKETKSKADC